MDYATETTVLISFVILTDVRKILMLKYVKAKNINIKVLKLINGLMINKLNIYVFHF